MGTIETSIIPIVVHVFVFVFLFCSSRHYPFFFPSKLRFIQLVNISKKVCSISEYFPGCDSVLGVALEYVPN